MFESLVATNSVSFILVFLEGVLSFFSPCIIPLIPVYMGFLAGNAKKTGEDGKITYERKKVFFHTLFFVFGISFAFFILGMSFTALGNFFNSNKLLFTRIGGILILILGLFQLGIFNFSFLQKERKIPLNLTNKEVNPLIALILGFTFSFAWTPCVGPALSSVLIMASGAKSAATGNLLVIVYALGFVLPFLLLGLFTTQVLAFLKSKQKLLKYTIKAGGIILITIGIMTFTGWMNGISSYLNSFGGYPSSSKQDVEDNDDTYDKENSEPTQEDTTDKENSEPIQEDKTDKEGESSDNATDNKGETTDNVNDNQGEITDNVTDGEAEAEEAPEKIVAFDFTLTDQYGNEHTLSEYKGKVVFLNFWATWCPPCKKEMPHIEELYQEFNLNQDEVVILGVANPSSEEYPNNQDEEKEDIISFLDENGYTFPTVFDETGEVFGDYFISSFPTTFMIDKEGNIFGYVPGMMTKDIMISIIDQTLEASQE